jgi:hypothetical protein
MSTLSDKSYAQEFKIKRSNLEIVFGLKSGEFTVLTEENNYTIIKTATSSTIDMSAYSISLLSYLGDNLKKNTLFSKSIALYGKM